MTREKAYENLESLMKSKDELFTNIYSYVEFNEADALIDKIYKAFKNRICKNCKYYNSAYKVCEHKKNIQPFEINGEYVNMFTEDDFGCNRFEKRGDS